MTSNFRISYWKLSPLYKLCKSKLFKSMSWIFAEIIFGHTAFIISRSLAMFHAQERMIECIFYACKLITCYPAPADLCVKLFKLYLPYCAPLFFNFSFKSFSEKKKESRGQKFSKDVPLNSSISRMHHLKGSSEDWPHYCHFFSIQADEYKV